MPAAKAPFASPELREFARNVAGLPYDQLMPAAAEAGWDYTLQQTESVGLADGSVLVTFQVFVGKDGKFEPFDLLTVRTTAAPVSVSARLTAVQSLPYLFFGRLPPPPPTQQQPTQTIRTDDVDIVLPADEPEQEYVEEPTAPIKVVARTEPDGVPIFVDLYALGDPTEAVIDAVFEAVENFLERATFDQINAMGTKNPMMIKFVKDLGTEKDTAELMDMITRRRNLVAPPVLTGAGRRRQANRAEVN